MPKSNINFKVNRCMTALRYWSYRLPSHKWRVCSWLTKGSTGPRVAELLFADISSHALSQKTLTQGAAKLYIPVLLLEALLLCRKHWHNKFTSSSACANCHLSNCSSTLLPWILPSILLSSILCSFQWASTSSWIWSLLIWSKIESGNIMWAWKDTVSNWYPIIWIKITCMYPEKWTIHACSGNFCIFGPVKVGL